MIGTARNESLRFDPAVIKKFFDEIRGTHKTKLNRRSIDSLLARRYEAELDGIFVGITPGTTYASDENPALITAYFLYNDKITNQEIARQSPTEGPKDMHDVNPDTIQTYSIDTLQKIVATEKMYEQHGTTRLFLGYICNLVEKRSSNPKFYPLMIPEATDHAREVYEILNSYEKKRTKTPLTRASSLSARAYI